MFIDPLAARSPEAKDLAAGGSPALYDPGEEAWPRKLHLGSGGIYLRGYENIDIAGAPIRDNQAQAITNAADVWDYYSRLAGRHDALPERRPTIADRCGDLLSNYGAWGYRPGSIDKVICIQMFEHLSPTDGIDLLVVLALLLRQGAPLILSVPDMAGTLSWLEFGSKDQRAFAIRHLYGSRADAYNHHKSWWIEESLHQVLIATGFRVQALPNFHIYPALVAKAILA